MRRASARLFLQAAGIQRELGASEAVNALPVALRQMGSAGSHHPETPLSKIMPPLVALPRQVVGTALSLTGKLVVAAATSGAVKSAVTSFADDVLLKEQFVKLSELDMSYWAYWLSTSGYTSQAGYKRLAEAALGKLTAMEPAQVTDLVVGFHTAGYHDKALMEGVSTHVSTHFTKYETEQLLKIVSALTDFGFYSSTLYHDIADSITYANSYLAPIKAPVAEVCKALSAFAKYKHERADLFVTLARGISEIALAKLSKAERKTAVMNALTAFHTFSFYPEQVDALLYFAHTEADAFSSDELKVADAVRTAVESQTGGKLSMYTPNDTEDAAHWYAHHTTTPAHYELFAMRDALIPKAYSPASMRGGK